MMRLAFSYVLAGLLCHVALPAWAQVPKGFENFSEAEFRYFGLKLYDAQLFTKDGAAFDWNQDFALEITYARRFSQTALVNSTMEEIARAGRNSPKAEAWFACFRTVRKGHKYLAVTQGADQVDFFLNGQMVCGLKHAGIARSFMGIFLGKNTRSAKFTRALRGG